MIKLHDYRFFIFEWRFLLYGFLMSFWSSLGQTFFISLFSQEIRNNLNLSHGQFGFYYAIATLASAVTLFWLGKTADKLTVKKLSIFTILCLCFASFHFSTISSITFLVLGIFFLRLFGQGMMYHVYSTAITRRYEKFRGRALAISGFGLHIAEAGLPIIVMITIVNYNWKLVWVILPIITLITFLPFVSKLTTNNHTLTKQHNFDLNFNKKESKSPSYKRIDVIFDTAFWFVIIWIIIIPAFIITGIFFHQIFIANSFNISLIEWSSNYVWYAISATFGAMFSGILIDKFSAHKVTFLTQLPMIISCYFLLNLDNQFSIILFFLFFGLSSGMTPPLFNSLIAERYGTKWLGEIKSLALPLTVFSSALSPSLLGLLIDKNYNINELTYFLLILSSLSFTTSLILFNIFKNCKFKK